MYGHISNSDVDASSFGGICYVSMAPILYTDEYYVDASLLRPLPLSHGPLEAYSSYLQVWPAFHGGPERIRKALKGTENLSVEAILYQLLSTNSYPQDA